MPELVYTAAEVAAQTGLQTRVIQRQAQGGEIGFMANGDYRFRDADIAKLTRRPVGRPRKVDRAEVARLHAENVPVAEIAQRVAASRRTVYNVIQELSR